MLDSFKPNVTFEQVHALYVFDKRLRLLLLDAIERIEIALRVDVTLELGRHTRYAHIQKEFFQQTFVDGKFSEWQSKSQKALLSSSDDFVKHFKKKYPQSPMPIWMAAELWDFGLLSKLIYGMKDIYVAPIAQGYAIHTYKTFRSWLHVLNIVRNICAHHGRLWNRVLTVLPYPRGSEIPLLAELRTYQVPANRLFAVLCIIQYFMGQISPNSTWKQRVKEHLSQLPESPYISPVALGLVDGWSDWHLWKTKLISSGENSL